MLAAVLETVPTDQLVIADDLTLRDVGPGDVDFGGNAILTNNLTL